MDRIQRGTTPERVHGFYVTSSHERRSRRPKDPRSLTISPLSPKLSRRTGEPPECSSLEGQPCSQPNDFFWRILVVVGVFGSSFPRELLLHIR